MTALAVAFLVLVLLAAVLGQRLLTGKTAAISKGSSEQCSICRNRFDKKDLVERQVGDFAIRYFCSQCVESLHAELSARRSPRLSP